MSDIFRAMLDTCIESSSFRTSASSGYTQALSSISATTINGTSVKGHTISDGGGDVFDTWGYFCLYVDNTLYPISMTLGANNENIIRESTVCEDITVEYCNKDYMIVFRVNNPYRKNIEFRWGGGLGADSGTKDFLSSSYSNLFVRLTSDSSLTGGDPPIFCMTCPNTTSYWRSGDNQLFVLRTSEAVSYVIVGWCFVSQSNFQTYLLTLNTKIKDFVLDAAQAFWSVILRDGMPVLRGQYFCKNLFTYLYIKITMIEDANEIELDIGVTDNIIHFDTPQSSYSFECCLNFFPFDQRNRDSNIKLEIREGNSLEEVMTKVG